MNLKEPILRFIQDSSQQLKLTYQSTLQSIQILNILEHYHHSAINRLIHKSVQKSKTFSLAILSLSTKIHEIKYVHLRQLAKLIHPKYQQLKVSKLQQEDQTVEEQDQELTIGEIEEELKQWEVRIVLWMKWKLAIPLLYDEVLSLAYLWDKHTSFLPDFPLKFQASSPIDGDCYSQNHNFLASNICICIYNFNHLIGNSSVEELSGRVKRVGLALFVVLIKSLMREKVKLSHYLLSPKLSVIKMLESFLKSIGSLTFADIMREVLQIEEILKKYRRFRLQSRSKKEHKQNKLTKKKIGNRSNKLSEEKQNIIYYVNRNKSKSKKIQVSEEPTEKYKSRSRSKKEKNSSTQNNNVYDIYRYSKRSVDMKDQFKIARKKESVLKVNKKKSNSTKSILSKNIVLKKDKAHEVVQHKVEKKAVANRSKISKRSQKSQLNSKILGNISVEQGIGSKSTNWLRSTIGGKTQKLSSNTSSIRMKLR